MRRAPMDLARKTPSFYHLAYLLKSQYVAEIPPRTIVGYLHKLQAEQVNRPSGTKTFFFVRPGILTYR